MHWRTHSRSIRALMTLGILITPVSQAAQSESASTANPGVLDIYARHDARADADGTIIDGTGRRLYLIPVKDIAGDVLDSPPTWHPTPAGPATLDAGHLAERLDLDVTSVAIISDGIAAAFLHDDQAMALSRQTKAGELVPDRLGEFSALWDDALAGSTMKPWGVKAVDGGNQSTQTHVLYIIDSGVHPHPALGDVARESVLNLPPVMVCPNAPGYAHGTHVAGIAAGNGHPGGVLGVRAGARIVSVNVGVVMKQSGSASPEYACAPTTASIIAGLKHVRDRIASGRHPRAPAIVNMSFNWDRNVHTSQEVELIQQAMQRLAFPASGYPGAFIAQSAGNAGQPACDRAYRPAEHSARPDDGIMVVAAIDRNGQAARPLVHPDRGTIMRFHGRGTEPEHGNNHGPCVDTYAPGVDVVSTWSNLDTARLSGTSMAAPHIAGLALHALESGLASSPSSIEGWLRDNSRLLVGPNLAYPALTGGALLSHPSIVVNTKLFERKDEDEVDYSSNTAWHISFATHTSRDAGFRTFSDSYLMVAFGVDGGRQCSAKLFRNGLEIAMNPPAVGSDGQFGGWHFNDNAWIGQDGSSHRFQVTCASDTSVFVPPAQTSVTAELLPTPRPSWSAATVSTGTAGITISRRASPTLPSFPSTPDVYWTAAAPYLYQGHSAPAAHSCTIRSYRAGDQQPYAANDLLWQSDILWPYRPPVLYQPMPDQATGLPGPPNWAGVGYRWLLTCWNDEFGHHSNATSVRSVEMTGRHQ